MIREVGKVYDVFGRRSYTHLLHSFCGLDSVECKLIDCLYSKIASDIASGDGMFKFLSASLLSLVLVLLVFHGVY